MTGEKSREYSRRHFDKRQSVGDKRVLVWLSQEAQEALATSMQLTGKSREIVMNEALLRYMATEQVRRL